MSGTQIDYLGPELAGTLMTPEEFDAVSDCDEEWQYELIHGRLIVMPPVSEGERGPNQFLGFLLTYYQLYHPEGKALDLTLYESYIRTPDSRRRADRLIWTGLGRTPSVRKDSPSIAVEFVSERKRDRHRDYDEKGREYPAAGVQEYWIIDRFRRQMTVKRPNQPDLIVREPDTYRTPLLPGFELPLAKLLRVADELEQASADEDAAT